MRAEPITRRRPEADQREKLLRGGAGGRRLSSIGSLSDLSERPLLPKIIISGSRNRQEKTLTRAGYYTHI
jgi:hypothetical protein